MTQVKRRKGWRMSCDVGEVTESFKNELCRDYNYELCSFSKISVTSPTSRLIFQPFFRFSYVTGSSLTSPGEPPMEIWIARMKIKLVVTPQWNNPPLPLSKKWRRGNTNDVNFIIAAVRERRTYIFCLSSKFCLKLFLIDLIWCCLLFFVVIYCVIINFIATIGRHFPIRKDDGTYWFQILLSGSRVL